MVAPLRLAERRHSGRVCIGRVSHFRSIARWLAVPLLALAVLLCVLPLIGHYQSYSDASQNFILYRWLGLPRTACALVGLFLFILALAMGRSVIREALASPRAGRFLNGLVRYYRFEIMARPNPAPRRDLIILAVGAAALQAIYFVAIPLGIECDGATFYGFAEAILGEGHRFSFYRPPLFPIYLIATGTVWPQTFVVMMLAQAAMGVAIPVLVYRCLYGLDRRAAWAAAIAVMASTISFTAAKLFLSEQLYAFLSILAVYYMARYQDDGNPRSIYAFMLAGLCAMFTRWEAEFIVVFGFCAIIFLALRRPHQLRHAILALGISVSIVAGYSVARALLADDLSLIGSLQEGSGVQMVHRLYGQQPYSFSHLAGAESGGTGIPSRPIELVNPIHGPASARLRDVVIKYVRENPDSYRVIMKDALAKLPAAASAPPGGIYEDLFGRFDGDPEALVDAMFETPPNERSMQYVFYMSTAAQHELGLTGANQLLVAVAIETLKAHPDQLFRMMQDGMTLLGIDLDAFVTLMSDPLHPPRWTDLFPVWTNFSWDYIPYDIGSCASSVLPARLMAEYRRDFRWYDPAFHAVVIDWGSAGRNVTRAIAGGIFLAGWWILLIARRRPFDLFLLACIASQIAVIGIAVGGANGKYEYVSLPLIVIGAAVIVTEASRRLRARRQAKRLTLRPD